MTPAALIMLVLTVVIVWGGLVATTVALRTLRTPDAAEAPDAAGACTTQYNTATPHAT